MDLLNRALLSTAGLVEEPGPEWDLTYASYDGIPQYYLYLGDQETSIVAPFFGPNGTDFYFCGSNGDSVYQYELSVPYTLNTGRYIRKLDVSAQDSSPFGLHFKSDGTKMFICGYSGRHILEYDLSTAWDISTATYSQDFDISAQELRQNSVFFKPDGTKFYTTGFGNDNVYEYDLTTAWDISTASYNQSFSIGSQEGSPNSIFFKPDGLTMFVSGSAGDDINEYTLTTAWDISTASYSQNFSFATQTRFPRGIFFKPDGKQLYVLDNDGQNVLAYFLSTSWDISTTSFIYPNTDIFRVNNQEASSNGLTFKTDGHKMYIVGTSGDDINEYDLTVAWDVTTASYNQNFSLTSELYAPVGIFFKPDGTKVYILCLGNDRVYEYNLTTAWDISTTSYSNQSFYVASQDATPTDVFFKYDGTRMYICGDQRNKIFQYDLSTAWDISTASFTTGQEFSIQSQEGSVQGLYFKDNGRTMYIVGEYEKSIFQYTLSTGWDVTTASYDDVAFNGASALEDEPTAISFKTDGTKFYFLGPVRDTVYQGHIEERTDGTWDTNKSPWVLFRDQPQNWFRVYSQENSPQGVFFKSDGLRMYIVGANGDEVNEYELTGAWDVRTASYVQNFSVSSQDINPQGLFFKSDGLKMFVVGKQNNKVYEYTLTTAWDISTASYSQDLSISANETEPEDIFFKPDGTEMYICGNQRNAILQYTLTTGWDISTASYTRERATTSQDLTPQGVFFKEDGLKMFVWGNYHYKVFQYNLSTAWDVSTVTGAVTSNSDDLSYFLRYGNGLFFKSDGTKCYITDLGKDYVAQLSLSTAWTSTSITFDEPVNDYLRVKDKETNLTGIYFKPDGTRLYITGTSADKVQEYSLSSPWIVSSATWVRDFSISAKEAVPWGLYFKDDGSKMFICGSNSDSVHEYGLSTDWDISTATFTTTLDVSGKDTLPAGIFFKPDGTKLYVAGRSSDSFHQYNLTTAWDLSTASFGQNFTDTIRLANIYTVFFK